MYNNKALNTRRVVRAGRRSTIGNRVNGQNRFEGSNPLLSAKKEVTFVYQKLLLFLSKPQAWYIITTQSCISPAPLGLYIITRQRVYYLRLDEMQHCVLMICNSDGIDDIQGFALIDWQKYDILFLKRGDPLEISRCEKRMVKTILGSIQKTLLPKLQRIAYNNQGIKDCQLKFRGSKRL